MHSPYSYEIEDYIYTGQLYNDSYVNPERSFPNILMMAMLNTRLEDTVNIPEIPVTHN